MEIVFHTGFSVGLMCQACLNKRRGWIMNVAIEEQDELIRAVELLEYPSLTAKITNLIGSPIERVMGFLPEGTKNSMEGLAHSALQRSATVALATLKDEASRPASNRMHKMGVICTGAIGGAFGLGALAIELPISTTIMMRSIADIARSEGERLSETECKLACLEVFALGGPSEDADASEAGYYTTRILLARATKGVAEKILKGGVFDATAPALLRFISKIAERFSLQLTEKMIAQAVPAIGAIGGATINALFLEHYQRMARGHFVVRRLERKYGKDLIQTQYIQAYKKLESSTESRLMG